MSDTYSSEIQRDRQNSAMRVVGGIDLSPDDAVRSIELSEATGVPAPVINADLESFERQTKAQMAGDFVRSNGHIANYIDSNPLAAQISSDDLSNLDLITEKLEPISGPGALSNIVSAFNHGMGEGSVGTWAYDPKIDYSNPLHRLGHLAWTTLGLPIEVPMRLFGAITHAGAAAVGEGAKAAGLSETWANRLQRDLIQATEANLSGNMLLRAPMAGDFNVIAKQAQRAASTGKDYVRANREPPIGVDPLWDEAKIAQSETDLAQLMDALSEAQKSATRERSPDMFVDFAKQQVGENVVGIQADAIRALYGEKVPEPGDGKLGFVPSLSEKLEIAEATGGFVDISTAQWLAKMEPDVAKALEDYTRARPDGVSRTEAEFIKAYHGSAKEFSAFDSTYIGSGEGAQAFAYGHYVAENQEVATKYKAAGGKDTSGNLYRVNIKRKPEEFLDWETDMDQQPAGKKILAEMDPKFKETLENYLEENDQPELSVLTGAQFHRLLERWASEDTIPGVESNHNNPHFRREASEYIGKIGVPGVKFLDQKSRGKTEGGTRNYVVFNDADLEITGKNETAKASMPKEEMLPAERATEAIRDGAALSPKERKLELRKAEEPIIIEDQPVHHFSIVAEDQALADVYITEEKGGKHLYVDNIQGVGGVGPNSIGPRQMRDILQQIKIAFPNAEELTGYRVTGARHLAGKEEKTSIKLAEPTASDKLFQMLLDDRIEELGEVTDLGTGWEVTTLPEDRQLNFERGILKAVDAEIQKLQAFDIDVEGVHRIKHIDTQGLVRGLYQSFEDARPSILFALTADDPVGVFRHEVIHDLRQRGFLNEGEWRTLEAAAIEGKWLEKYQIESRYKDQKLDLEGSLEEAIADEFADWRRQGKPETAYSKVFQKIEQFIEALRAAMRQLFGTENWKDIFDKIESGEVYQREPGTEFGDVTKLAQQPELPGTRRMEDRAIFDQASAIGMTVDQYKRYMKLIAERHRQDLEKAAKDALDDQRKKQTQTWKDNYKETRDVVADEVNARPEFATDNLIREGRLYGDKVDFVKIGTDYITAEQRDALPRDYTSAKGAHPDDIAALTGYPSGQALVEAMAKFNADRKASGLRPAEYSRRVIDAETERQMEAKYGKLGDTILQEAKEQVLSETQLDLLHEEVLAMGLKAGAEFSITKEQMKLWVAERFQKLDAKDVSSDKFLADAGRAGRAAEDALLRKDPAEAFRQKQRQYLAVAMSRQAKDFEDAKQSFAKTAERLTRKENKAIDKDFMNFAQGLLSKAGYNIKRSLNELADSLDRSGHTSFDEFVQSKIGDGWELTIADDLRQGREKKMEDMTAQEFLDLKDAIDQMYHVGREAKKIEVAGQKMDFEEVKSKMLENIRSLPVRKASDQGKLRLRADASWTRMEEIAKDLDLREEAGPLWSALIRPMIDAKHTEYSMMEDLAKRIVELKGDKKWVRSMDDTIPQDFFIDPYDGVAFDLTRQHMIQIMLNFGNRSNIDKFTRGYIGKAEAAGFEAKLWDMIHRHATKEDWNFVQGIWDIWKGWQAKSADQYYELSGRQPKWIEPEKVVTPHGEYAGGYYPIIYDRLRSNINAIEEKVAPNALFGPNYFRASPANHYTKERTGFADRIQFQTSIEQAAGRMQQLIHDIAYRRPIMDASKIVYDKEIRGAIRKHYGEEYEAQLSPWVKDIANHFNSDEVANNFASAVMRRARMNLVAHALGFNLKVIGSPAVAKMNPMDVLRTYSNYTEASKLAYEKSREIPHTFRNIDRDFRERLEQTIIKNSWSEAQATAVRWAFTPVVKFEQQFRIITWYNEYQQGLKKGFSDGEASALADSAIRERHGSSGLPDMPAIMRGSEGMKIATMFYGYFSTMYNWQRQIPGNLRRGEWMKGLGNLWGSVVIPAAFGAALFNQSKEGDSWGKIIGKALLLQPLSTMPFIREAANWLIEGNPARTPIATIIAGAYNAGNDVAKIAQKKKAEKPIQHFGNVIGLSTGLPMAQISRTAQFAADVKSGHQRPRNILEWSRGIITGEARLKK